MERKDAGSQSIRSRPIENFTVPKEDMEKVDCNVEATLAGIRAFYAGVVPFPIL